MPSDFKVQLIWKRSQNVVPGPAEPDGDDAGARLPAPHLARELPPAKLSPRGRDGRVARQEVRAHLGPAHGDRHGAG